MRSRVEIVAEVTPDGRPRLARLRAEGQLAARPTGPDRVHLVSVAAGPLGGDEVEISVRVAAGARLVLRGVAATLALPDRSGAPSVMRTDLVVEDGAFLDADLPPLVVCSGASITTVTRLTLAGSARAELAETAVLGRHGEAGGDWSGRLVVDRDGRPVLRSTQRSEVVRRAPAARVVRTCFLTAAAPTTAAVHGDAVLTPLASGDVLVTATGAEVPAVEADAAAVLASALAAPA